MSTNTINTQTRREYAQLLRCFLAGKLTTDEYEDQYYAIVKRFGFDAAADDIFDQAWHLYDDIVPHRMTGNYRLLPSTRRHFAMCVLFLRTETPYELSESKMGVKGCVVATAVTLLGGAFIVALIIRLASAMDLAVCSGILTGVGVLQQIWVKCIHAVRVRKNEIATQSRQPEISITEELELWPFSNDQDLNSARQTLTFLFGGRDSRQLAH